MRPVMGYVKPIFDLLCITILGRSFGRIRYSRPLKAPKPSTALSEGMRVGGCPSWNAFLPDLEMPDRFLRYEVVAMRKSVRRRISGLGAEKPGSVSESAIGNALPRNNHLLPNVRHQRNKKTWCFLFAERLHCDEMCPLGGFRVDKRRLCRRWKIGRFPRSEGLTLFLRRIQLRPPSSAVPEKAINKDTTAAK